MTSRIYVACLASYNAGKLYGNWINANQSMEEIQSEIATMLAASPEQRAEEWAIHDYEGFGEISLSEWPDIERVSKIASLIEDHGDAFSLWYSTQDGSNGVKLDDFHRFTGNMVIEWTSALKGTNVQALSLSFE